MKQLDLTKPVQTRDGRPVRILCTDAEGGYPVVGLIADGTGWERPLAWRLDGRVIGPEGLDNHTDDLFNAPVKRRVTGWVNVYPEGILSAFCSDKNAANENAHEGRIACIPIDIEFTEGDGLEGAP